MFDNNSRDMIYHYAIIECDKKQMNKFKEEYPKCIFTDENR